MTVVNVEETCLEPEAGGRLVVGPMVEGERALVLLHLTEPGAPVAGVVRLTPAEVTRLRQVLKQTRTDALVERGRQQEARRAERMMSAVTKKGGGQ